MKKILVYTKEDCVYCNMAKTLLANKNLPFEEIDLTNNHELREEVAAPHHWRTLPMIFIDDSFVGGFRELAELNKKGLL